MKNKSTKHWLTLLFCCFLAASSVGLQSNSYGVFCSEASKSLGVGQGAYALHQTLSNLCMGLFCPMAIAITKKNGLQKSIFGGLIVTSICTAVMGIGSNLYFYYIAAIIRGIGNSFLAVAMVNIVVNNWFMKQHGLATGLTMSFSGLSGAVFSPIFTSLISTIGWRQTYFVMAACTVVLALPAALYLKFTPEEVGLVPYGANEDFVRTTVAQEKGKGTFGKEDLIPMSMLVVFTVTWNMLSGFTQFLVGYSQSLGFSAALGASLVSTCMIGNVTFKLLIGVVSDKIGPINACVSIAVLTFLGLGMLYLGTPTTSQFQLMLAGFLFGGQYSVGIVGISLLTKQIFSRERFDTFFSYLNIAIYVGGAFSLTLIGTVYDYTQSYVMAMYLLMGFMIIDVLIILGLKKFVRKDN